ncbi:MAG: hypothetical protein KDJ65_12595 [Anaerolineae bacterium]|nr:hypothetical protein [Anaerolineae bacterium]
MKLYPIFLFLIAFIIGLLGISLNPHLALAEEPFYVATDGSDSSGDGSDGNPWATIGYAIQHIPDNSSILVKPGTYSGEIRLDEAFDQGITIQSQVPYQARLRHDKTVITIFRGKGITIEGFDIAHSGPGAGAMVIQIQDLIEPSGGDDQVSRITLRNNVIHDSYNNDLLKINNGAAFVTVENNVFYNQTGRDEHIDINSVSDVIVQDNIFFNDFEGSGRTNNNDTASFIVIKDSNEDDDTYLGAERITLRRNVFLNWQGQKSSFFIVTGEDGKSYYEAKDVMIENNLMIGNSHNVVRAVLGVKGCRDITFRNNTIVGDLPSVAYAMRLNRQGDNLPNANIQFYNNIWSDPTGTMGAESADRENDFSDTSPEETESFTLYNNLYWNGGNEIPLSEGELINYTDDNRRLIADPLLERYEGVVLPRWNPATGLFMGGTTTIRESFELLVKLYGVPYFDSTVLDAATPDQSPVDGLLGQTRNGLPDIGAVEILPVMALTGRAGDESASLAWYLNTPLPEETTWHITYTNPNGETLSPISVLANDGQSYTITGLTNHEPYAIVVQAMLDGNPILTSNPITIIPTDHLVYLPTIIR